LPELFEFRQAILWLIAGDDACIDGADGGADDPVGLDARLVQRLIDAALIGAKRATSLQHSTTWPLLLRILLAASSGVRFLPLLIGLLPSHRSRFASVSRLAAIERRATLGAFYSRQQVFNCHAVAIVRIDEAGFDEPIRSDDK